MIPCYTLYTNSVSVKRDHSLLHCTQSLTVSVHQDHFLLPCTHSVSTKTIPCYTVHSVQQDISLLHCTQCPTRPFPTTLYTVSSKTIPHCSVHSHCLTRPSPITLYTISVQQDLSLLHCTQCSTWPFPTTLNTVFNMTIPYKTEHSVQQDHFLLRCTQWPPRARSITLYTVSVQQDHFLRHCTQPVSKKIIPYYLVIVSSKTILCYTVLSVFNKTILCYTASFQEDCSILHCTQCPKRPFSATQPVSKKTVPYYTVHSVQQDHSIQHYTQHSQCPPRPFLTIMYSVHQDHSLL